jgi:hypothetical protein
LSPDQVARRLGRELSRGGGISVDAFDALLSLHFYRDGGVRVGAWPERVPLSLPALGRPVSRFGGRGLVVPSAAENGRAVVLPSTDRGTMLTDWAIDVHVQAVAVSMTGRLPDSAHAALLDALGGIG